MFLCIDSDTRHAGIALGAGGRYFVNVTNAPGRNDHTLASGIMSAVSSIVNTAHAEDCVQETVTLLVEMPQLYIHGAARRNDLLKLAFAGGIALGVAWRNLYSCGLFTAGLKAFPISPKQWKGDRPKLIHQRSICEKKGWEFEEKKGYIVPKQTPDIVPCSDFKPSDYKHIMDAVGMCIWAEKQKPQVFEFFEA